MESSAVGSIPLVGWDDLARRSREDCVFIDAARLAASICGTMFAAVTLADEGALWFAGTSGFEAVRTDQAGSFCDRTIAAGDLFVVEDAAAHPDFKDARFVVGELRMRFYAGIPLMGRNGVVFGTLCVGDQRAARSITPEQFRGLALLAEITIDRLDEHRALIAREAILGSGPIDVGGAI